MGPRCSSAETQVCHRSYIIAASCIGSPGAPTAASSPITPQKKKNKAKANEKQSASKDSKYEFSVIEK